MATKKISKVTIRQAQDALAILFPSVKCTVAPNGQHEIWVKDEQGYGFALTLSSGKAGVSATIRKFAGAHPVTVTGNKVGDMDCLPQVDMFEVFACVYRADARAQAFKAWYGSDVGEDGEHTVPYPEDADGMANPGESNG